MIEQFLRLFGRAEKIWLSGVVQPEITYRSQSNKHVSYGKEVSYEFSVIMEFNKQDFEQAKAKNGYSPAQRSPRSLQTGKRDFYIKVSDQWGNTSEHHLQGWAIPGLSVVSLFIATLWGGLFCIALTLAPVNGFCHALLMNPWMRKAGSFGLVPLALSVLPALRRHVLRRYLRGVRNAREFADWQTRFVIPAPSWQPDKFGTRLEHARQFFLRGQSGIGKTSYCLYLTGCYADKKSQALVPRRSIPIYIPLARYRGEEPQKMVCAQMKNYGQFTDEELASWFIQQGGFVVFFDGLNEVSQTTRDKINTFVTTYAQINYFVMSAQERIPEFAWVQGQDEMTALTPEKVKEILQQQLCPKKAQDALSQFTPDMYNAYGNPQELAFAIELINAGQPVPPSRQALYHTLFQSMVEAWVGAEHADYPRLLCQRAYDMLCTRDPFFTSKEHPIPDTIRDCLEEQRFLVKRGTKEELQYYFRHGLIRAYLAAQYLALHWQDELLKPDITVDENWRTVLELLILRINDSTEVRALIFVLLRKSREVAVTLFKWIDSAHPTLCSAWRDEFFHAYGKVAVLLP